MTRREALRHDPLNAVNAVTASADRVHLADRATGYGRSCAGRSAPTPARGEVADAEQRYRKRGLVPAHLVGWCDEVLALLEAGR